MQRQSLILVLLLLRGQFNIKSDALTAGFGSAFVGRFHDTPTATGYNGKTRLGHLGCGRLGKFVMFIIGFRPGRSEYRNRRADGRHLLKTFNKFGHYAKYSPRLFGWHTDIRQFHSPFCLKLIYTVPQLMLISA